MQSVVNNNALASLNNLASRDYHGLNSVITSHCTSAMQQHTCLVATAEKGEGFEVDAVKREHDMYKCAGDVWLPL